MTKVGLTIIGLGPGDLGRLPRFHRAILEDPDRAVVVRTMHHPAASQLAGIRSVATCDDLYENSDEFSQVYDAIAERVLGHTAAGPTVYAVPGSPLVGEFAVRIILERIPDAEVVAGESFVDAVLRQVDYDPFQRGLRILNGHELPHPLALDCPVIIGHLDAPVVLADVTAAVSRVLPGGSEVTVCANLGAADEQVVTVPVDEVPSDLAGFRTSMFIDTPAAGLVGVVEVSRRLRAECPWDREQTHFSLVPYLMEETAELAEAIARLPDEEVDWVAYDAVEDELGDVLLQVLFHAVIAAERGAFDIDDVATRLQEKLVRRHPHVFGDVEVAGAGDVIDNWKQIKADEKGGLGPASLMDGVPDGMPALERAAKLQRRAAGVGFDWENADDVMTALSDELEELRLALAGDGDVAHELGDVLFSAVNLARRLELSPEVLARRATARFEERFRRMEALGPLEGLGMEALEERWQAAKRGPGQPQN